MHRSKEYMKQTSNEIENKEYMNIVIQRGRLSE
jgi:hypothetical protein